MGLFDGTRRASVVATVALAACASESTPDGNVDAHPAAVVDAAVGDAAAVADTGAGGLDVVVDPCLALPPPPCPVPSASHLRSVCGSVRDVQTSAALGAPQSDGLEMVVCEPLSVFTGVPCTPLASSAVDECGRYQILDVADPGSGFIMLVTDDKPMSADDHLPASVIAPIPTPGVYELDAWAVRHTTISDWNVSAARPPGERFEEIGAVLMIFRATDGTPVAGVTVTKQGMAIPDDDFYFSDTGVQTRISIDPASTATGLNGSALVLYGDIALGAGAGGEPAGCHWGDQLAGSLPSGLLVQDRIVVCP
jgi:hypothetical protein